MAHSSIKIFLTILFIFLHACIANRLLAPKVYTKKYSWELDTKAMLAKSNFNIKPDTLIERCKEVVDKNIGLENPDDLADDFSFQFPVIGPLTKSEYIKAVQGFELKALFPDLNPQFCDFRVDPFQPNRVWFTANFEATHTGDTKLFGKATGRRVICPPQAISLTFNADGKVVRYTGGYVMDKTLGNSGGMGGAFGPLWAIGKGFPFPEAKPYSPSIQFRIFSFIGSLAQRFSK